MKLPSFDYVVPDSIEGAVEALDDAGYEGVVLAGGQTLVPLLALRMSEPSVIVDINRIEAMKGVSHDGGALRIGAATRQKDVLADAKIAEHMPLIAEAVSHVGHVQTRSRGTIGGSIANGEPAAELPATALAMGATLEVVSANGARDVPIEELYLGPYATSVEPDELVTAVRFPDLPSGAVTMFRELARRPGDFALVGLVGWLAKDGDVIRDASFAWFGMGPTPIKLEQAAAALKGQAVGDVDVAAIAQLAIADADPFDDALATAHYRRTVGARIFAAELQKLL